MPKRSRLRTPRWEKPANADLLRYGAASAGAPVERRHALLTPAWWRSLPRKIAVLLILPAFALAWVTYLVGGIDGMASLRLRKEIRQTLPASDSMRRFALELIARRPANRRCWRSWPGWPTYSSPNFVTSIDELASADASVSANRFNALIPPEGLPTSEWFLDELGLGFGDPRPVTFVLVADSTGDAWKPMAFPPDEVPPHARRIRATTVGEALRIGLWGVEEYRPELPTSILPSGGGQWRGPALSLRLRRRPPPEPSSSCASGPRAASFHVGGNHGAGSRGVTSSARCAHPRWL